MADRETELAKLVAELAGDLEAEIIGRFGGNDTEIHQALRQRYKRDMDSVYRARAFLRDQGFVQIPQIEERPRPTSDKWYGLF